MNNREITIKDVAKKAEVSVSTVSRVLNRLDRVSEETRRIVQKAVDELNYVPNAMAASIVTKQTHMLAVVVPEIENAFYTAVIKGTVNVANSEGYRTIVFSTNDDEKEEDAFFNSSLRRTVDGIILIGAHTNPQFYCEINKPVVLVDRYIEGSGLDGVVIDNFGGTYESVKYLIDYGHHDIAIIAGPQLFNDGIERFRGYQQALHDHGIIFKDEYHKQGGWIEQTGYQSVKELMSLPNPPTAIFASNNLICQGALKALRDLEIQIGTDISIIGFDENPIAEFVKPRVSVVKRPTYKMGVHAAEMLIAKIRTNTQDSVPKKLSLGVELMRFGSVKNLNETAVIDS